LLFFSVGAVFAFLVVAPVAIPFLASILRTVENQWRLESYFSFVVGMMMGFGAAFELPIVMAFIARIGIIDATTFRSKRRIAILLIFIASAALTPQDPFTMLLMAMPLMGLYELGIRFAALVGARNTLTLSG
jgi:sec-independent protein translocase protein TatC